MNYRHATEFIVHIYIHNITNDDVDDDCNLKWTSETRWMEEKNFSGKNEQLFAVISFE